MRSRLPLILLVLLAAVFYYVQSRRSLPAGKTEAPAGRPANGTSDDGGAAKRPIKVALLLTGPTSDDGWNASAYEGLVRAKADGAEIAYIENLEKSRFEDVFRQYAASGSDLLIGHGYEFQDAALRVAPDFPRATFVIIAGNRSEGNVSSIAFQFEDATFALGALSAWLSRTGKAGLIGGEEIPSLKPGFDAFAAGARWARPGFVVITKYVGSWNDVALAKEHANALIHEGADFIFQNADKAGLGVFQAVEENPGRYAFGSNKDQNALAPRAILASAVIDVPQAVASVAAAVRDGRFASGAYALGVREGIVSIVLNPALASVVPDSIAARMDSLEARIAAGDINLFEPEKPPGKPSEGSPEKPRLNPPAGERSVPPPDWLRR